MEKKLMLLGLLRSHKMHVYQLNEMLQSSPGLAIDLKKANAYRLLKTMEADGWVTHEDEQEGNRPQKRVYSLTDDGEQAFLKMLRENLSTFPTPQFPGVVGLDFVYALPLDEALELLGQRRAAIEAKAQELDAIDMDIRHTHLSIAYLHQFYANELSWLTGIIRHLSEGHS